MKDEFALNRRQIEKICALASHFKNVDWFNITIDTDSGIGPAVYVRFNQFHDEDKDFDTQVDITDVSTW